MRPVDLAEFIYENGFMDDWRDCGLSIETDLWSLEASISAHPTAGGTIAKTGGLRKLRWQSGNKGKRGGVRVIYMFMVYPKSEMDDISNAVRSQLRANATRIRERLFKFYGED